MIKDIYLKKGITNSKSWYLLVVVYGFNSGKTFTERSLIRCELYNYYKDILKVEERN